MGSPTKENAQRTQIRNNNYNWACNSFIMHIYLLLTRRVERKDEKKQIVCIWMATCFNRFAYEV